MKYIYLILFICTINLYPAEIILKSGEAYIADIILEERTYLKVKNQLSSTKVYDEKNKLLYIKKFVYDSHGKRIEQAYYTSDGELYAEEGSGIAKIKYEYDLTGNLTQEKFFGSDNRPNKTGLSKKVYTYDKYNHKIAEETFVNGDVLENANYRLFFSIPGSKKKIEVKMDSFYRPIGLKFIESL